MNYASWKNNSRRVLKVVLAWEIVSGAEEIYPAMAGHMVAAVVLHG
jgi:hypothetical protein